MMDGVSQQPGGRDGQGAAAGAGSERCYLDDGTPLCFVVDKEESHRHFVSLALQSYGIETALFAKPHALREGLSRRTPDLILLDVSPASSEAVEAIRALAERSYRGPV